MEVYSTEEQQEEAIKNFLKENGLQIFAGAAIGLGGFMGWSSYVDSQIEAKEAASVQYETFLESAGIESASYDTVTSELATFTKEHGESGYAVFVQLIAAKQAIEEEQFDKAAEHLTTALSVTDEPSLQDLVMVRLARIEMHLAKYDQALATLAKVQSEGYKARVAELEGDIYFAQGNVDKARTSYQAAADNGGLEGNNFLEMKLNDLAVSKS